MSKVCVPVLLDILEEELEDQRQSNGDPVVTAKYLELAIRALKEQQARLLELEPPV